MFLFFLTRNVILNHLCFSFFARSDQNCALRKKCRTLFGSLRCPYRPVPMWYLLCYIMSCYVMLPKLYGNVLNPLKIMRNENNFIMFADVLMHRMQFFRFFFLLQGWVGSLRVENSHCKSLRKNRKIKFFVKKTNFLIFHKNIQNALKR